MPTPLAHARSRESSDAGAVPDFVLAIRARLNLIPFLSKRISDLVPENHEWDKTPMQEASWMQKYFEKLKKFGVDLACL